MVREHAIALPPLSEQAEISSFIENEHKRIREITEKIEASIDRLREFRSALITAAVTGQIDVNEWSQRGSTDAKLDAIAEEMEA